MATQQANPATWEDAVTAATDDAVARWRLLVLLRAGYVWDDAVELAMDTRVDLHLAVELLDKGCTSAVARRILL